MGYRREDFLKALAAASESGVSPAAWEVGHDAYATIMRSAALADFSALSVGNDTPQLFGIDLLVQPEQPTDRVALVSTSDDIADFSIGDE